MQTWTPLKKFYHKTLALFPERLPSTTHDWDKFTDTILKTYDFPDMPGYHQSIATLVLHLPNTTDKKSKSFFAKTIRKMQANEIAYNVIEKLKEKKTESTEDNSSTSSNVSPIK